MKLTLLGLGAFLALLACGRTHVAAAEPTGTPVLLELFTSEGCSSCPPADAASVRLAGSLTSGARVVVLAHHVDYWDRLGWPDPFSSAEATARQRSYAALGGGSYTPQAVIDGQAETVGSRPLDGALGDAARRPHVPVELVRKDGSLAIKVGPLPDASEPELVVAVVQDRAQVRAERGENAGRTLEHAGIVRSLRVLGGLPAGGVTKETPIALPAATHGPSGFSVVAFVQERTRRRVLGTASLAWR